MVSDGLYALPGVVLAPVAHWRKVRIEEHSMHNRLSIGCTNYASHNRLRKLALSLIVAFVSVMAVTIPAIKHSMPPPDASIHVNVRSTVLDHITYGPKVLNTFAAIIFVTNNGRVSGAIKGLSIEGKAGGNQNDR